MVGVFYACIKYSFLVFIGHHPVGIPNYTLTECIQTREGSVENSGMPVG